MMVQNFYFNSSYVLMCINTWISVSGSQSRVVKCKSGRDGCRTVMQSEDGDLSWFFSLCGWFRGIGVVFFKGAAFVFEISFFLHSSMIVNLLIFN